MIRTKTPKMSWIASDLLRVGLWKVSESTDTGIKRTKYRYGSGPDASTVIVDGQFKERDKGTFLLIRSLDRHNNYQGVHGHLNDLLRHQGTSVNNSTKKALRDSIDRLLDFHLRIKPNKERGLSAVFKLISGQMQDDEVHLYVDQYINIVESNGLYEVKIPLEPYFQCPPGFTRNVKYFLQTQANVFSDNGYYISLEKLLSYNGYDTEGKKYSWIWNYVVKKALENLKKEPDFTLKKFSRDKKRKKDEGGVIWLKAENKSKNKKELPVTQGERNDELLAVIKEQLSHIGPDLIKAADESKYRAALNDLKEHAGFGESKSQRRWFKEVLKDYSRYIDRMWGNSITYLSPQLFRPGNAFLEEFVAKEQAEGRMKSWGKSKVSEEEPKDKPMKRKKPSKKNNESPKPKKPKPKTKQEQQQMEKAKQRLDSLSVMVMDDILTERDVRDRLEKEYGKDIAEELIPEEAVNGA